MDTIIYRRSPGSLPFVISRDHALLLMFGAGADANHEPRTFTLPLTEAQLEVLKSDFTRHLLLDAALAPLGVDAGITGPIDESAALAILNTTLFGTEADVEAFYKTIKWYEGRLIEHHANPVPLATGKIFEAANSITEHADPTLAKEYYASRRHLFIPPLDEALLRYTNTYFYGGGIPSRNPDALSADMLPRVLAVISAGEEASAGMELPLDYGKEYEKNHARDKEAWNTIKHTAEDAVRAAYPDLRSDTVATVSFLLCAEAASRVRSSRKDT